MITFNLASSLVAAFAPVLVPVQDSSAPPAFDLPALEIGDAVFHRRTLANGLQAIVVEQVAESEGTASVFMVVGVGTGHEGPATSGLAHLVEHTMYTGTARWGVDEHERQLVEWGAESNAFTREDYTLYYDHGFGAEHLNEVLEMEADRLVNLVFDAEGFLHERYRLAREEAGAFTQAEARGELLDAAVLQGGQYGAGLRDAKGQTMGPKLSLAQARDFYELWYAPRRTAVVVAGAVDAPATLDAIEVAFGGLAAGPAAPAMTNSSTEGRGGEARFVSSLPATKTYHAWVGPAQFDGTKSRVALTLLARVLRTRHREDAGTPLELSMGGRAGRDMFVLGCAGDDGGERLLALFDELRSELPSEEELVEARADMADDFAAIPVRGRPYFSLAGTVGTFAVIGDATWPARWPEILEAVGVSDVTAAVEEYLDGSRRQVVVFEVAESDQEVGPGRVLPSDKGELAALAQDATEAGDLDTAIAAYEKLLALGADRMNSVIYGFYLGSLKRENGDLKGALADLEAALEVVDYPDVRELANEIRDELESGVGAVASKDSDVDEEAVSEPEPSGSQFTVTSTGDLAPEFAAEAAGVMGDLEAWRGLDFKTDLLVEFILRDESTDGLNGWYEPDTKRLVVIENENVAMGRGTMLHEMFHALQDQNFDLLTLDMAAFDLDTRDDSFRALRAIIEGEAMLAVADLMDYDFEQHTGLPAEGELDADRFAKIFHYGAGLNFIRSLREAGGWAMVDRAFREPPRFTASILHPDRYIAGVRPEDLSSMPTPECGCDEEAHAGRVLGEFGLSLFLARDVATRSRSAALAGRMSGDLCHTIHDAKSGIDRFAWYLSFYDSLAASEFANLAAEALGLEVWALDESGLRIGVLLSEDPLPSELAD